MVIFSVPRALRVLFCAAAIASGILPTIAQAQSGDAKPPTDKAPPAGEAGKAKPNPTSRLKDELAEAAKALSGAAANPECVWLGQRVVGLLWRDDLDTAFRHLDLYDRFGCPGAHVQAAFRCVVQQGYIDPKTPETLNARVHSCWINPTPKTSAETPAVAPTAEASHKGTNSKQAR